MAQNGDNSREPGVYKSIKHIENRRLFDMVAGLIQLEPEEQEHLRNCRVCEGVVLVLQKLTIRGRAA